jgi:hypothetical protein
MRSGGIAPQFLSSAQNGGEWSASRSGRLTPGEIAPGTHWIWGWVGPRVGLDTAEKRKIIPRRESNPGRLARRYTDSSSSSPTTTINNKYNNNNSLPFQHLNARFEKAGSPGDGSTPRRKENGFGTALPRHVVCKHTVPFDRNYWSLMRNSLTF